MRVVDPAEIQAAAARSLGLDPEVCDLTAPESMAAALRRAAAFLCPCPRRTLVDATLDTLKGLFPSAERVVEQIENILEAVIAHGDLLEAGEVVASQGQQSRATILYAAPPRFVWRQSAEAVLLGIAPDQRSPLPSVLEARIDYENHVRRLPQAEGEDLRAVLKGYGLTELSPEAWLRAPARESSGEHVRWAGARLRPISGELPDLEILDSETPVRYYRGRWKPARDQSGRFVARRSQHYGNPLWCYVELIHGQPRKVLDFPTEESSYRGCDEAWWLQAAIDANRGQPQEFRVRGAPHARMVIDFFSPVPMWARRRWDAVGTPVSGGSGMLFAYTLRQDDLAEEVAFIRGHLWLAPV